MKKWLFLGLFCFGFFIPVRLVALEQPPFEVDDVSVSENFREIYLEMDQHKHNNDDSSRLENVIPSSGSTYALGNSSNTWAQAHIDTVTVINALVSTITVNGNSLFVSSFSVSLYDGYSLVFGSGSVAANTTVTIKINNFSVLGIPVVSELEDVNTAATSVRVKTCCDGTNSFGIYNSDVLNAKRYTFMVNAHR